MRYYNLQIALDAQPIMGIKETPQNVSITIAEDGLVNFPPVICYVDLAYAEKVRRAVEAFNREMSRNVRAVSKGGTRKSPVKAKNPPARKPKLAPPQKPGTLR